MLLFFPFVLVILAIDWKICNDFIIANLPRLNCISQNSHLYMFPVYCGQSNLSFLWQMWRMKLKLHFVVHAYYLSSDSCFWHETAVTFATVSLSQVLPQHHQLPGQGCVFSIMTNEHLDFCRRPISSMSEAMKTDISFSLQKLQFVCFSLLLLSPKLCLLFPNARSVDFELQDQIR